MQPQIGQTQVGIVMSSRSEWSTMKHTAAILANLGIAYEARIVTTYRNTNRLQEYASNAIDRGLEIIIAGSGKSAHIPGILASKTEIPVLEVSSQKKTEKIGKSNIVTQKGNEGFTQYSTPDGMLVTGNANAVNAALLAASILGNKYPKFREKLSAYRDQHHLLELESAVDQPQDDSRNVA